MGLNDLGSITAHELQKSVDIRKEIQLDIWVIMPNHIHMIVFIVGVDGVHPSPASIGEGACHTPLRRPPKSIPSFVAGFKSATTKIARVNGWIPLTESLWQPNYHDRIVRNDRELDDIRAYILANPQTWETDEYH